MKSLICLFVLVVSSVLYSQVERVDSLIGLAKGAYLKYDSTELEKLRAEFSEVSYSGQNNIASYYNALLGYKLLEMNMGDKEAFDQIYENALREAERLIDIDGFKADGLVLQAAVYMMKIATNPISAVTLSSKIHQLLDEAQSIDSANPYSYVIRGMMKFNTPEMFGGSYEEALKNFSRAVLLFENNGERPAWGYAESLAWLGRTYVELGDYQSALFTYRRALNAEPEYGWVKHVLLPEAEKKYKESKNE
ncbi:tetratricopeptide repeat protein [Melioribacter sp. Ez-97]|uniref:tetratricopeptide repeat protein n=1 Tax=Melioribacter sp. Ez-97 TaxID=3423434 RepID=UPI003ED86D1B